ncbi:uncharacterized protein EMH_0038720 [Eimeria mitis]|uniref:SAG family member n=1 Tax=Eimeria mitis TaxID=44415 RepID=U6JRW4_9EIME|nr:uncharacterized protein EMH_0038720 [Eimeria mitis]CDJ28200.1 hypothetical protein EMH_0038720 [Eimeria mitis]
MASLYKTAAVVCVVALSGLKSEAQPVSAAYKFTVVNVDEDAYVAANLARNGKLPVHISGVTKDSSLVSTLTENVTSATGEADAPETPNYRKLLQEALEKGLQVFNTQIGCVIGKCTKEPVDANVLDNDTGTTTEKAALFCKLQPAATANQAAFDEEYFNGLITRKTALADMTEDDLKASVGNGAAAAAVPTILIAGLLAMFAAVSA